jgi:RNA methyltransferase, TrmH family
MFSKQQQKYVQSLQIKKYRQEHQRFLVEGAKSIVELLNADFEIELLLCTEKFYKENEKILKKISTRHFAKQRCGIGYCENARKQVLFGR